VADAVMLEVKGSQQADNSYVNFMFSAPLNKRTDAMMLEVNGRQ
jgi:hypothetical protein